MKTTTITPRQIKKAIWPYKSETIGTAGAVVIMTMLVIASFAGGLLYFLGADFSTHSGQTALDRFSVGAVKGIIGPLRSIFAIPISEGLGNALNIVLGVIIPCLFIGIPISSFISFLIIKKDFANYKIIGESAKHFPDELKIDTVGKILLDKSSSAKVKGASAVVLSFGGQHAIDYLSKFLFSIQYYQQLKIAIEALKSLEKIGGANGLETLRKIMPKKNTMRSRLLQDIDDKGLKKEIKNTLNKFFDQLAISVKNIETSNSK